MHRQITSLLLLITFMLSPLLSVHPYTFQYASNTLVTKWPTNQITVTLSSSLSSPPGDVKAGSDVVAAANHALQRWSEAANLTFIVNSSSNQSVSPSGGGDGISLITIASTPENVQFVGTRPGRTRVFFDPNTGAITEADVVLNPNLFASNGGPGFSTDGTSGTYDLESTLQHEIGHLLGLDHSGVIGATMQPRQGQNFTIPGTTISVLQTTVRTLSDDDISAIRTLYGARPGGLSAGAITGTINYGAGAHVWAENAASGRVFGSAITKSDGTYRIDQVPPGDYRVIVEFLNEPVLVSEITASNGPYTGIGGQPPFLPAESTTTVTANTTANVNFTVTIANPTFNPRTLGLNGIIQPAPVPVVAGQVYRFYVGGEGLDLRQVPPSAFSIQSPIMSIDPASFVQEDSAAFGLSFPVVSFDLHVSDAAKFGDYSLRIRRSDTGEVEYLAGAITVDPYTDFAELNPLENNGFFVRQQYLDFLSREPDQNGFNSWVAVLNRCLNNTPDCDRVLVSKSFFQSTEFQLKGFFVYRFYRLAFNRRPAYAELIPDMQSVTGATSQEVFQKRAAFANAFIGRQEFRTIYDGLTNTDYVNKLMDRYTLSQITTPDPNNPDGTVKVTLTRNDLLNRLNTQALTRAQVLRAIVESDEVAAAEYNGAFVEMQYVGYLRRDPDTAGYNAWLSYLTANPSDFRTMVNGFVNSREYRSRFGQP